MAARFRINAPAVVGEVIDGEAIVMHLETGTYYSLDGAGALIWDLLSRSVPLADVVEAISAAFDGPPEEIAAAVRDLAARLAAERLIVEDGGTGPPAAVSPPGPRAPFRPPILNRYTDMQHLLLVDPIHEVDEAGWPHAAPGAEG